MRPKINQTKTENGTELLFVGIDPGTTTAVSLLNTQAEFVDYKSKKEFSIDEITQWIIRHGKPIVVSCDVSEAPSLVHRISSAFGARQFSPEEDILIKDKKDIAADYNLDVNDHVRDSFAAAYTAYDDYEKLLDKIELKVGQEGLEGNYEDVVELVIKHKIPVMTAISEVRKSLEGSSEDERDQDMGVRGKDWKEIAESRLESLKENKQRIDHLESYVDELENENSNLEKKIESMKQEEDQKRREVIQQEEIEKRTDLVRRKTKQIKSLNQKINKLEEEKKSIIEAFDKIRQGWRIVKVIKSASQLNETEEEIVYIDKGVQLNNVAPSKSINLAITGKKGIEPLKVEEIKVIRPDDIDGRRIDSFYLFDEDELKESEESGFKGWLKNYRQKRND